MITHIFTNLSYGTNDLIILGTAGMPSKCGDDFWTSIEQIRESIIGLSRDHSDLFCVGIYFSVVLH